MLLKRLKIPEYRNVKLDRKFSVAPMMDGSICRENAKYSNWLG
jgi:hypothetical protein